MVLPCFDIVGEPIMQESLSMDMNASDTMIPPASAFRMNKAIQHLSVRSSRLDKANWN